MAALEVLLFGGFQLRNDGEPLPPVPSRAARSLMAYLVLDRGVRHSRDRLAAQFWPDLPPARARRRLSHTLWQLQDALGELPGGWDHLQATTDAIAIDRDAPCWIDVEEFERRLDTVRAPAAEPRRASDRASLEQAVELYRGDFLAGHYDDWVLAEQQRLAQRHLDALSGLIGLARSTGDYAEALVFARRLTHHDPLREDAHREVMRLCTLLGRTSDALRQYERCREVLAEELGTEPAAATEQLYQRILRERDAVAAPRPPVQHPPFPTQLPLAGRDREREQGVAVLEQALAGRGGLVLVEADPGHGKSRLLAELVDDGLWRGFRTLQAVCRGPELAGPYAAVRQLLEPVLTPLRVEQLRHRVEPVWLGVVAQLLPSVAQALPPEQRQVPAVRSDEAAQRLRHALARTMAALAGLDPLLVVVDDLHWADDSSLQVLVDVAAQAPEHGLALLLGYRGEEARARPAVWDAVRDLDRRVRPVRIVLAPLDPEAVADVVRAVGRARGTEAELAARLHRETGGNPLFVVETLRMLTEADERGGSDPAGGDRDIGALPLPATIRDLVLDRLDGLSTEQRNVVDLAAVGGDGTDLDSLVAACDLPRLTVADATASLVGRALLCERDDGFGLQHEQIRRVVLEAMPAAARRALHRRFGDALEHHHPRAVDRLAHHFVAAGDHRKAVHYLRAAGRQAAGVHAYTAAEEYLRQAVETQRRRPASVSARFALLAEYSDVLDVLGDRAAQQDVVAELATLAAGSAAREVEARRRQALLEGHLGNHAAARVAATQAVELATSVGDEPLSATCRFALAQVLAWGGERRAAVPLFVRAVRAPGLPPATTVQIRTTLASVLRELQRYRAAALELDAALDLARSHAETREEAQALGVLGTVRMETGHATEATALYGQAIDRCRAIGFPRGEGINLVNRANVHYVRGLLAAALDDYQAAAGVFAQLADRRGEAAVRLNLGVVAHAVLGDDDRAVAELTAALDFFADAGDAPFEAAAREALAGVALRAGDTVAARRHVRTALALAAAGDDVRGHAQLLTRAAEVALAEGVPADAARSVREALALAERHALTEVAPWIRALQGRVHLASGDLPAAEQATASAVALLHDGVERPWLVHLAHHDVLRASGRDEAARRVAADAADSLGALLAGLPPDDRARAEDVPEHRRILTAAARVAAEVVTVRVAAATAPRGRPLRAAEYVEVEVALPPGPEAPDDPIQRRRWLLSRVVTQITDQGGAATTADLAGLLDVSEATVRRDLAALRSAGRPIETRGRRTG
ncbi:BTAD domain-containing putative transcriptional regulator [Egicoccus sp. AB-alg6-2]|uniref:BTAD domain-containing putative transcriptional regulator n=1 Tax=Egicoccus sp. AB-alg6-2 TaxID=3242692 RepID=UPI00359CBD70